MDIKNQVITGGNQVFVNSNEDFTTKAAKCPSCGKYHMIASFERFNHDKEVRKEFAEFMVDGFDIIDVTTEDAKSNFGYC